MGINILYALWIFFGIYGVTSQGDSLRSALNAVDRRQRYFYDNPLLYPHENSADLSYLPDADSIGGNDLLDYFTEDDGEIGKHVSSSFRERQGDREKQLEELSQRVLSNLEGDSSFENSVYRTRDPWRKYRNDFYSRNDRIHTRKRQFYPDFGYDSIGLRKREKFTPSDYQGEFNYLYNVNNDDYPNDYLDAFTYTKRASLRDREGFRSNYWSNFRHIPVTKRSSEYPKSTKNRKQQQQGKTDPKIEKDLSSVFAGTDTKKPKKFPKKVEETKSDKKKTEDLVKTNNTNLKTNSKKNDTKKTSEEIASEKPIQISKKSIEWSDYFGLDRRKKSKDFEKEWAKDRYHKAIAMSKKTTDYPLQSFRDHDATKKTKRAKNDFDETKLENLDRNLKSIEDEIVDDALKYTGANEGVTDPKDIEEVEDGIISRLAKAYSIEKMRRALGEYKMLVDKEREKFKKEEEDDTEDDTFSEEKRVSVPRKQAVDPNRDDKVEDNHIKCTQGNADCDEENYKTPIEVIEQMNYEVGGCPRIQRDCRQVAALHGQYAKVFEEACNIHQMCLLCGNNSWYPATRQCNILYMSKVYDMCEGKAECQKEMQKSVRYLMSINRNIRDNPSGECNLVCPDGPDGA